MDSDDVATLVEEVEDPNDIPLAMLEADLKKLDSEIETLQDVVAKVEKAVPAVEGGQVETYDEMFCEHFDISIMLKCHVYVKNHLL